MRAHGGHDVVRYLTLIKRLGTLSSDAPQHLRQRRVLQQMPDSRRLVIRIEIRSRRRLIVQITITCDLRMQPR
jgi:hypothetical protein